MKTKDWYGNPVLKISFMPGVMTYTFNPSPWEVKTVRTL